MRPSTRILRRRQQTSSRHFVLSASALLSCIAAFIVLVYVLAATKLIKDSRKKPSASLRQPDDAHAQGERQDSQRSLPSRKRRYQDWKQVTMDLARLPALDAIHKLETEDPFGTRAFERKLLERESHKGAVLDRHELKELFSCPTNDRITLPDHRNHNKAVGFRSNKPGSFLFFQHLRKAGGTNFCTLAEQNLPKRAVASYYCMSDLEWSRELGKQKAGYLHHWSNEEITARMLKSGHRITGNEWDNFDRLHHFDLPGAIFATSFRRPMDRALSQFRFECIEDRGCKIKDVGKWWKKRKDLYNIYTVTFADVSQGGIVKVYEGTDASSAEKRAQLIGDALDTVSKFHLVLAMEWLAYSKDHVERVLGFQDTSALTHRVRPHVEQYKRQDGQEENKMGAAGIAKASWTPKEYLTPEQYQDFAQHLALDEILTDAARRMFLERMACDDLES